MEEGKGNLSESLRRVREKLEAIREDLSEEEALRLLEEATEEVEGFGGRLEEEGR